MDKRFRGISEEELKLEIIVRTRMGHAIRAISRDLEVDRKKIRRILEKHNKAREEGHDALDELRKPHRESKLDRWQPMIRALLEKFPDITSVRLLEELEKVGYQGKLTIVQDHLREIRPKPQKQPVIRFETRPGEQGQMDWSPYRIRFLDGGVREVLCFSYILGYSRRQYIDFTLRRDFHTLIRRHIDAFNYFGGVPEHCLYDGEKTVLWRWEAGHPVYNASFLRFLIHYGTRPVGCRSGRPQTKGKVEQAFRNVEGNFMNGREFLDFDDLRRCARRWMNDWSDSHKHRTTGRSPLELFLESERQALISLPAHSYDASEVCYRVTYPDGNIHFQSNTYSVPFQYIGMILALKATEQEVAIYSPEIKKITVHERLAYGAGLGAENPDHRQSQKDRYGLEPIRQTFLELGEYAEAFLQGLARDHPRRCGLHARCILAFKQTYDSLDINKALQRAHRYHAYEPRAISHILRAKAKPRSLEASRKRRFSEAANKNLPEINQRDLRDYPFLDKGGPRD